MSGISEPFDETEKELDRLEPAWADFAHGARTGVRMRRDDPARETGLCMSLAEVAQQLAAYRARFDAGESVALLHALSFALEQTVPPPHWVAVAARERLSRTLGMASREPLSLHDAFDLGAVVPLSPKRYAKDRAYLRAQWRLYRDASSLMCKTGCTLDAALRQLKDEGRLTMGLTKARELFEKQQEIQRAHVSNTKTVRRK